MNFQFGSPKGAIIVILAFAILAIALVIGREIYRAVHPPNKPMRKRKRKDY